MTLNCRGNPSPGAFSRLATVRRPAAFALALVLGATAALALASCGGGDDAKLLPGATAQEISENLDRVKQYAEEDECVGAADAVGEVNAQVEALTGVDAKLKRALQRGTERLGEVVASCEEEPTTEAVEPATEATTTESTEPPGQEKKREKEREKAEKEAEKPPKKEAPSPPEPPETTPAEPPAPTTPAEEVPPTEDGGTGASGGVSPGAPVGGGE
jgi:outer membrane biosynthesis protein TonB